MDSLKPSDLFAPSAERTRLAKDVGNAQRHGKWMDERRKDIAAIEYLRHMDAAKKWIEECTGVKLPESTSELGPALQNGVVLAKLCAALDPNFSGKIFEDAKLQFRHSDNINRFFRFCKHYNLPNAFFFETNDLYALKNIPKVVYSLHATSHLMAKVGKGARLQVQHSIEFEEKEIAAVQADLDKNNIVLPHFESVGKSLVKEMGQIIPEEQVVLCQNAVRLCLQTKRIKSIEANIVEQNLTPLLASIQLAARDTVKLKKIEARKLYIQNNHCEEVRVIQSAIRQYVAHKYLASKLEYHRENNLEKVIFAQRVCRQLVYNKMVAKISAQVKSNALPLLKVQAVTRGHISRKRFVTMRAGAAVLDNPDAITFDTFAKHVHMFVDNESQHEPLELEIANLHAQVVMLMRENADLEEELASMDTKIELLVRNRVNIGDLLKDNSRKKAKKADERKEQTRFDSTLLFHGRPRNRSSRRLLEAYQGLLYILQTKPVYITRLVAALSDKDESITSRTMEICLTTLFGHIQHLREEFLALKLFEHAISFDAARIFNLNSKALIPEGMDLESARSVLLGDSCTTAFTMMRWFMKCPKICSYLRSTFETCIEELLKITTSIETDPVAVHKLIIQEEESATGRKTSKKYDTTLKGALEINENVVRIQKNEEIVFGFAFKFFEAILKSLRAVPYCIRYIISFSRATIAKMFNDIDPTLQVAHEFAGKFLFLKFYHLYMVSPELFEGISVSALNRKNLLEVSKYLNHIFTGQVVQNTSTPLPAWMDAAKEQYKVFLSEFVNVPCPETQLHYDSYADSTTRQLPTVLISPNDILFIHEVLLSLRNEIGVPPTGYVDPILSNQDLSSANENDAVLVKIASQQVINLPPNVVLDPLARILDMLGPVADYDRENNEAEVIFTLSPRFSQALDSKSQGEYNMRRVYAYIKQEVIKVIRILGDCDSIPEMLNTRIDKEDEEAFVKNLKLSGCFNEKAIKKTYLDILSDPGPFEKKSGELLDALMSEGPPQSLRECLKLVSGALELLATSGMIPADDDYATVLRSIARDFRKRHKRAEQQRNQLASLKETRATLIKKQEFLQEQERSYAAYIEACKMRLSVHSESGAKKKRTLLPFSKQARHQRAVEKAGIATFGSFIYGLKDLMERGVVMAADFKAEKVDLTISSTHQGVFDLEIGSSISGFEQQFDVIRLEDLLQYEYAGARELDMFNNAMKFNVQLLLNLINKKFYS